MAWRVSLKGVQVNFAPVPSHPSLLPVLPVSLIPGGKCWPCVFSMVDTLFQYPRCRLPAIPFPPPSPRQPIQTFHLPYNTNLVTLSVNEGSPLFRRTRAGRPPESRLIASGVRVGSLTNNLIYLREPTVSVASSGVPPNDPNPARATDRATLDLGPWTLDFGLLAAVSDNITYAKNRCAMRACGCKNAAVSDDITLDLGVRRSADFGLWTQDFGLRCNCIG